MRSFLVVATLLISPILAHAEIQFVGVMTLNGQQQFGLQDTETKNSQWLSLGGQFSEFTLESFQASENTVTLRNGGTVKLLKLQTAPSAPAKPAASTPEYYSVKPGDTGSKIARTHKISVKDLVALNPGVEFTKLKVGDSIRIK
ncbi:MAG: LysM domain-containing protein [Nibricoccus sp.]